MTALAASPDTTERRTTPFPDAAWTSPVLRSLDARARAEIEAAGRVRVLGPGEVVHRVGDPADAIYVVVDGACVVEGVKRGDTGAAALRSARTGEIFGEEAIVTTFATRAFAARADERGAAVAEVPVAVLRRAVGRVGEGEAMARLERVLRRAATLDLLRTTSFGRALAEADLERVVDACKHLHVARGEAVFREGDDAAEAFFVADGLLQAQSDDGGRPRVEAYLTRGDLFGDDELATRDARALSVMACGPAWVVAVPRDVFVALARRAGPAADLGRRLRTEALADARALAPGAHTTAHVFRDLYRMRVARSLLVIDQDSCIRCGLCAYSCSSVHDDGISRLVRRGDKIVVRTDDDVAPLLVPNSCQHCKNPACMIDCPTGAIGRDARGEVFIREDLCTGCGSCAKACPWDNIQIAKRKDAGKSAFADVAVKCDLCAASASGPACVSACPTEAIARVDPNAAFAELRAFDPSPGARAAIGAAVLPSRTRAWPFVAGAAAAAVGLALVRLGRSPSGWLAGALFVALVVYAAAKRAPRLVGRARLARSLYIGHAAFGVLAAGATVAHAGMSIPRNAAGALSFAMFAALASGGVGALVNALVPRRLARLERTSVLPEELAARGREIDERIYEKLSGRSELVKTLFGRVLRPYRRARLGGVLLALSGRSLREEEARLRARIDVLVSGRKSERLAGIDELVRLVVERRAVAAQRLFMAILRGWLPVHLSAAAAAVVLLALHVLAVWSKP